MRKTIICIVTLLSCSYCLASNIEEVLNQILSNNLYLRSEFARLDARTQNRLSSLSLPDTELEYALLCSPGGVLRHDVGISQTLDFATLSGRKKEYILSENKVLDLEYLQARKDILITARSLISEILYRDELIQLLDLRLDRSLQIEDSYKYALEQGDLSGLEYQRMIMESLELSKERDMLIIERTSLLSELNSLNSGIEINLNGLQLVPIGARLLPSFESWFEYASACSSSLKYEQARVGAAQKELSLRKSEAIPSLSVGYMAELVEGGSFRGVRIGLSIPIWSSKRKIAAARSGIDAAMLSSSAAASEFALRARAVYDKLEALGKALEQYSDLFSNTKMLDTLYQAYKSGQISLFDYYTQSESFYLVSRSYLTTKLQYATAFNELKGLEY